MGSNLFYGTLENAISFGRPPPVFTTMPVSRMAGSGRRRCKCQRGAGVIDKAKQYLRKAKEFIQKNKLISRGLNYGADYLANSSKYKQYAGLARAAASGASMAGLGKRRRKRKTRRARK